MRGDGEFIPGKGPQRIDSWKQASRWKRGFMGGNPMEVVFKFALLILALAAYALTGPSPCLSALTSGRPRHLRLISRPRWRIPGVVGYLLRLQPARLEARHPSSLFLSRSIPVMLCPCQYQCKLSTRCTAHRQVGALEARGRTTMLQALQGFRLPRASVLVSALDPSPPAWPAPVHVGDASSADVRRNPASRQLINVADAAQA